MIGLWSRILARYLIGAVAGILAAAGLQADLIEMIRQDPEIVAAVTLALAGVVEWVTSFARRKGWLT